MALAVTVYFLWILVAAGYVDVPYWDQWNLVNPGEPAPLWLRNNEHLIVFPRLFFWIDDVVFRGRNQFNIAAILGIQALQGAVLVLLARTLGYRSRPALFLAVCTAGVILFATCQRENFTWGFQVQFVLVFAAFSTGAYALTRYASHRSPYWLAAAVAAGVVSCGSMANGVAALPILAVLALGMRRPRAAAVLLAAAVIVTAIFFVGYVPGPRLPHVANPIRHLIIYGLAYLGNPFARTITGARLWPFERIVSLSAWWGLGVAALAALALLLAVARTPWLAGYRFSPPFGDPERAANIGGPDEIEREGTEESQNAGLALASIILFTLAAVAVTAAGRGVSADDGQALAIRYATSVVPLLVASLFLVGHALSAWTRTAWARGLGALGASLLLLTFALLGQGTLDDAVSHTNGVEVGMLALAVGAHDNNALQMLWAEDIDFIANSADLRAKRRSLFSEPWARSVGRPLSELVDLGVGGRCEGTLAGMAPPPVTASTGGNTGISPNGSVWAPHDQQPTRTIVLASAGRVVGLGRINAEIRDIKDGGFRRKHAPVTWHGEMAPGRFGDVAAYLMIKGGRRACKFAEDVTGAVPVSSWADPSQAQVPLKVLDVRTKGQFPINGSYPDTGAPTRPGVFYGSWAGSDANTGSVTLLYGPLPDKAVAVLVPILEGPGAGAGSISARLTPSGQMLGRVEPNGDIHWAWWRVALPHQFAGQRIEITATDGGSAWGQWIAVGSAYAELAAGR